LTFHFLFASHHLDLICKSSSFLHRDISSNPSIHHSVDGCRAYTREIYDDFWIIIYVRGHHNHRFIGRLQNPELLAHHLLHT
jgi:hypothetical protein